MSIVTTKIDNQPVIIADDILVFDANTGLKNFSNAISGSFTYPSGSKPCSIMVNNGVDVDSTACHSWLGFPETVLYRYKNGTFGIGKFKTTSEIPDRINVLWAVGGMGLLDMYNPNEEGFSAFTINNVSYNYSDVLRRTNHTSLAIKNGMCHMLYLSNMTGLEVNNFVKNNNFKLAIMLDGGHLAGINGSEVYAKINTSTIQGYAIQGINNPVFASLATNDEIIPSTTIIYKVQVGAFSNKDNAEKLKNELISLGYSAIIVS